MKLIGEFFVDFWRTLRWFFVERLGWQVSLIFLAVVLLAALFNILAIVIK